MDSKPVSPPVAGSIKEVLLDDTIRYSIPIECTKQVRSSEERLSYNDEKCEPEVTKVEETDPYVMSTDEKVVHKTSK